MANDIKLQEGHPVDENLRPIKVGGKSTALETAQHGNGARVNGDLEVTGDIKGNIKDMVLEDVTVDTLTADRIVSTDLTINDTLTTNSIASTALTIDDGGDITLDAFGGQVFVLNADLHIPIDKKVVLGGASEYITGDDTDISIKAAGHVLVTPAGANASLKILAGATEVLQLNSYEGGSGGSIRLNSIADTGDYCKLKTTTTGVTTLETVDDGDSGDGTSANLTLDIDGDITLDSATGVFEMHGAGATAKFADMYAGMILGYTRIANDGTSSPDNIITVNTSSMTVLQTADGTDLSIQFIVPPSGNVEIQCSFWLNSNNQGTKFSLSTAASYAELGITHTYDADNTVFIDETDHTVHTISFAVTGLVAGTDTTYYLAGLASSGMYINHGRFRSTGNHFPPIILRAIALPATIVTGE